MGNGQCPECCGVPESWFPHPCHPTPETLGHELDCPLAAAIKEAGGNPLYLGQSKLLGEYVFAVPMDAKGNPFYRMVPKGTPGFKTMGEAMAPHFEKLAKDLARAIDDDISKRAPFMRTR